MLIQQASYLRTTGVWWMAPSYSLKRTALMWISPGTPRGSKNFCCTRIRTCPLDITSSDGSGFGICEYVRRTQSSPHHFPLLTALDEEVNVICGSDCGGDDYITKPFVGELCSRIRALGRQAFEKSRNVQRTEASRLAARGLLQLICWRAGRCCVVYLELTGAPSISCFCLW